MRDVITVYDTEKHQLADKVRRLAERRGDGVSMNDVVRDHLAPAVDAELREWERVDRTASKLSKYDFDELEKTESRLLGNLNALSPAEHYLLDEIQAELKRRSKPTVG